MRPASATCCCFRICGRSSLLITVRRERILELQEILRGRADVAPPDDWLPVDLGAWQIGVTSPQTASFLATEEPQCALLDYRLVFEQIDAFDARTELLNRVATRLHTAGLVRGWRNEQLDVGSASSDTALATIERAACRVLGIPTSAVHLNAFDEHDNLLV